jgi:hypothetical protein
MPPTQVNIKLVCPKCGTEYDNYSEYFACWTRHLNSLINNNSFPPSDRIEAIKFYRSYAGNIEEGLKIFEANVTIFHGVIDLIGADKDGNFVLIDVINDRNWKRKIKQLCKYRKNIRWIAKNIYRLNSFPTIRLLLVNPNKFVKDVTEEAGK